MLKRLRNRRSAPARWLAALACAALLMQALVPVGFMIDRQPGSNWLTYVLCPDQGPIPVASGGAHAGHQHHHDGAHQGDANSGSACPYAVAFVPLVTPSTPPSSVLPVSRLHPPQAPATVRLPDSIHYRLPARGPPVHS